MTMASAPVTCAAALAAAVFFTVIGRATARFTGSWTASASVAPALGWAMFVALSLPVQLLIGLGRGSTALLAASALVAAVAIIANSRGSNDESPIPRWAFVLAAIIALIPLAGMLPKVTDAGFILGPAASDHSKVAMIDAMTRLGLPAANPFFAAHGERGALSYYYLWHFGAAQLSVLLGISGWETDAAMTGVTAYASLLLMMGLAVGFQAAFAASRSSPAMPRPGVAVAWVAILALTGTLRPLLGRTLGWDMVNRLFANYRDLESWLSQASWVPQHLAAANSAVLIVLLLTRLAEGRVAAAIVVGVLAAAAFGSSAWIGGVTLAATTAAVGVVIVWRGDGLVRRRFLGRAAMALVVAVIVAVPLLLAEFHTLGTRHGGSPVAVHPYEIIGTWLPPIMRRVVDLPAFWLILLPLDLPAVYPVAVVALFGHLRRAARPDNHVIDLAIAAATGLIVSWLLISTIGNNDLGWRAMLPPTLVLLAAAAAGLAEWLRLRRWLVMAMGTLLVLLSIPDPVAVGSLTGRRSDDAADFAEGPALWSAVRRYAGPDDRVANNPLYLDDLTSFPVNISWALMANRSSCYAGWETAQVYVDLPKAQVRALDAQFIRVFAGKGSVNDVRALAQDYGCRVAVVTDSDGAWTHDPFAASLDYRLAERAESWRIYVRR